MLCKCPLFLGILRVGPEIVSISCTLLIYIYPYLFSYLSRRSSSVMLLQCSLCLPATILFTLTVRISPALTSHWSPEELVVAQWQCGGNSLILMCVFSPLSPPLFSPSSSPSQASHPLLTPDCVLPNPWQRRRIYICNGFIGQLHGRDPRKLCMSHLSPWWF